MQKAPLTRAIWLTAVTLVVAVAGEVWNRDWTGWSQADAERVLTNSPWAAKTSVSFDGGQTGGYPAGGGRRGGGGWSGSGGGAGSPGAGGGSSWPGGGGGGGIGSSGGGRGRPRDTGDETQSRGRMEVLVRWESALPVKEALLKQRFGNELPKPGEAEYTLDKPLKDYVISVSGLRMSGGGSGQNSGGDPTEHMQNILISSTQLLPKNGGPIDPEQVKVTQSADGTSTARFAFPKTQEISLDNKEVVFEIRTSWMKIEKKFKLKDMAVDGKLAL